MSTAPEGLGPVNPEIFRNLEAVSRPGSQLNNNYRPSQLLEEYQGRPLEELYEALHPLSEQVFAHFTETTGREPTDMYMSFSHAPGSWNRRGRWRQALFMPGEQVYETESNRTIQFAVGEAPALDFVPNIFLNHIVKGLVASGRLSVEDFAPGELVRSDTYSIRRDLGTDSPAPQIAIAFRVMNGFASVAQLESSRRDKIRTSLRASRT